MGEWITKYKWEELYQCQDVNEQANFLQSILVNQLNNFLPEKTFKLSSDDKAWITAEIKDLDRKKKREFAKNRRSEKYVRLKHQYDNKVESSKQTYYENVVKDLKDSQPGQWYSKLKRISNLEITKENDIIVDELDGLNKTEQAEQIANAFSEISNQYQEINYNRLDFTKISSDTNQTAPTITAYQVFLILQQIKTNKATIKGDIPAKILKEFAVEISEPLSFVINNAIKEGVYPDIFKAEKITPVPKVHPPTKVKELRKISGTLNLSLITEKVLSDWMNEDMIPGRDSSQYDTVQMARFYRLVKSSSLFHVIAGIP